MMHAASGPRLADHGRAARGVAAAGAAADGEPARGAPRADHSAPRRWAEPGRDARRIGVNRPVVVLWEQRFRVAGLAGLAEAKGRGRKPSMALETKAAIVSRATQPPPGRSRWSVRSMARAMGVSKATVQRLWAANDLKPHVTRAFKLSNDPQFEAKFWDVIGLYLEPPEKALVLCCDEKSQCQALERTQPGLRSASAMCARAPTTIPATAPSPCCGAVLSRRQDLQPDRAASYPPALAEVPQAARPRRRRATSPCI